MVDRAEQLEKQFELKFKALNWDTCDEHASLGGLLGVASLLEDGIKRNKLRQLAAITAVSKQHKPKYHEKARYSLEVNALLTYNKRSPKLVPSLALAQFYESFFDSKVARTQVNKFIHDNVSLVVTRRVYTSVKKYNLEIVGALSFSLPAKDRPTYLAYIAVSHGEGSLPSLSDTQGHVLPPELSSLDNLDGYQGFGIGSLLVALLHRIMLSTSFQSKTNSPYCFLHYNKHNVGTKEGWLNHGFEPLLVSGDKSANDRKAYEALIKHLARCPIFSDSHVDSDNCMVMFLKVAATDTDKDKESDQDRLRRTRRTRTRRTRKRRIRTTQTRRRNLHQSNATKTSGSIRLNPDLRSNLRLPFHRLLAMI